ncbi:MAG: hypothetical protein FWE40_05550 [Oscillospiraceae bacterium]|jgi:hypothetical protein|nr:hypothetical protein [Oscillospiraceae bacterium]
MTTKKIEFAKIADRINAELHAKGMYSSVTFHDMGRYSFLDGVGYEYKTISNAQSVESLKKWADEHIASEIARNERIFAAIPSKREATAAAVLRNTKFYAERGVKTNEQLQRERVAAKRV